MTHERTALPRRSLLLRLYCDCVTAPCRTVAGMKLGEIATKPTMSPALVWQRKCRALRAITVLVSDGSTDRKARRMLRR